MMRSKFIVASSKFITVSSKFKLGAAKQQTIIAQEHKTKQNKTKQNNKKNENKNQIKSIRTVEQNAPIRKLRKALT